MSIIRIYKSNERKSLNLFAARRSGEIGLNSYIYGYGPPDKERFIIVDLGVSFPDMETTPGVDLILPDISWIKERRDRIEEF